MKDNLMTFLDHALLHDDELALDLLKMYFDEEVSYADHSEEYEDELQENEIKALRVLFEKDLSLYERAIKALEYDKWCLEAILINSHYLGHSEKRDDYFYHYYQVLLERPKLTKRGAYSAKIILAIYANYLFLLNSLEESLTVQKLMLEMGQVNTVVIVELLITYAALEKESELLESIERYFNYLDNDLGIATIVDTLVKLGDSELAQSFYDKYVERHKRQVKTCEDLLKKPLYERGSIFEKDILN